MIKKNDVNQILLEAHKRGVKLAVETSIRTGVPLVVEKNGKIVEIKPKYKYIKVLIKSAKKKAKSSKKKVIWSGGIAKLDLLG